MVALNAKTGEQIWRVEREQGTNWATPYVWENAGRTEDHHAGTKKVRSYDLNGKTLWEFSGMSSIAIPTPFFRGTDWSTSHRATSEIQLRPVYAIKPGASGDIFAQTGERRATTTSHGISRRAGLTIRRRLFTATITTRCTIAAFLPVTMRRAGARFIPKYESIRRKCLHVVAVGLQRKDLLFKRRRRHVCDSSGQGVQAAGKNSLDEMCMATPAIVRGSLIIRTASKLYRITKGGASKA